MRASEFWKRFFVLGCVVILPFVGFLLSLGYPLLRAEVIAAAGMLAVSCALLAAVSGGSRFYVLLPLCGVIVAAGPVARMLSPSGTLEAWFVALALLPAAVGVSLRCREKVLVPLVVFAVGTFLAHAALMITRQGWEPEQQAASRTSQPESLLLYLILDQHCGLCALPAEVVACREFAERTRSIYTKLGFTLYSCAYSHYANTANSIPSVLNGRLVEKENQFLRWGHPDAYSVFNLEASSFFRHWAAQGYRVVSLEDRRFRIAPAEWAEVATYGGEYEAAARAEWPWTAKFRLIVGAYQSSDAVLTAAKGLFPFFRFGARTIASLSPPPGWPEWLAGRMVTAERKALFFAHLLASHSPFLFRKDGLLRPPSEWENDQDYSPITADEYRKRYRRYCEHQWYVHSQLERLFRLLEQEGLWERTMVVIHGDHGSHIRLRRPGMENAGGIPQRYDYASVPPVGDLLDRFSVLLAVKPAGRGSGRIHKEPVSLLRTVWEFLAPGSSPAQTRASGSIYLFDDRGNPVEIELMKLWHPQAGSSVI